jgi:hypothetical protein
MPDADPPQDDELRVDVILVGDAWHLAIERLVRGAGRRRAHRRGQPRRPEAAPQLEVVGVLRQQAIRPPVVVRQDGFGPARLRDLGHPPRDQIDRFGPGHPFERGAPLRPLPYGGIEQALLAVDTLPEAADLGTDEVARDRVVVPFGAVDGLDAAVLDRDVKRTGVRAIQWARGANGGMPPPFVFGLRCAGHSSL